MDLCELCGMIPADCTCDWMRGPDGTGVHYMKLTSRHAEQLHSAVVVMGWNQKELRLRTGIDRNLIGYFYRLKRASVKTGFRIAMALAAGSME